MFRLSMNPGHKTNEGIPLTITPLIDLLFTNLGEVHKGSLFSPDTNDLWGFHHQFLLLTPHHLGVLLPHDIEHSIQ